MTHNAPTSTMRKSAARALLPATAAVLALAATASPSCAQEGQPTDGDTIVYVEGGATKERAGVTVTSWGHDRVVYTKAGRESSQPASGVIDIKWGDAPSEYVAGWRSIQSGEAESARQNFVDAIGAREALSLRKWVDEYANVGLGEAHLMLAASDEAHLPKAISAFNKALGANGKSLYLDHILKGLAEAELASGRPSEALKHAGALLRAGKSATRPQWELDALFVKARAQESRSDFAGAATAYDELIRVAESQARTADASAKGRIESARRTAAARKGWLLIAKAEKSRSSADFQTARSYFESLKSRYGQEPEVLAAISNAVGVVKLSSDDAHGALRDFQATEVLYFSVPSEVARSLYYQALCWEKLGNEKHRKERARDLKEYYPKSEWARKLK